eukprot:84791-Amorphochlora_amoeboformis.AAC.1
MESMVLELRHAELSDANPNPNPNPDPNPNPNPNPLTLTLTLPSGEVALSIAVPLSDRVNGPRTC